jgi:hypothetical protein
MFKSKKSLTVNSEPKGLSENMKRCEFNSWLLRLVSSRKSKNLLKNFRKLIFRWSVKLRRKRDRKMLFLKREEEGRLIEWLLEKWGLKMINLKISLIKSYRWTIISSKHKLIPWLKPRTTYSPKKSNSFWHQIVKTKKKL